MPLKRAVKRGLLPPWLRWSASAGTSAAWVMTSSASASRPGVLGAERLDQPGLADDGDL